MNIIKVVLLLVLVVVVLFLVIALFVKKNYTVEREIVINKPPHEVYNYVKYLKNQDYYNKWVMQEKQSEFRGTDGQVGFVYAWSSDGKAGKGEQEIKTLVEGKVVNSEVRFEKPFKSVAQLNMLLNTIPDNKTKIIWTMHSAMPYPMNLMTLFIRGALGKDMDESLRNLKGILEK